MARPDPIQYAERLYGAIRAANFSPISFLAFGNAIKDGVSMRNMPRIAAEPFMRVVGEMLDLEEETPDGEIIEAAIASEPASGPGEAPTPPARADERPAVEPTASSTGSDTTVSLEPASIAEKRRGKR
jgi:hypothetical protein